MLKTHKKVVQNVNTNTTFTKCFITFSPTEFRHYFVFSVFGHSVWSQLCCFPTSERGCSRDISITRGMSCFFSPLSTTGLKDKQIVMFHDVITKVSTEAHLILL